MRKDKTILKMIIPRMLLAAIILFCSTRACAGQVIRKDYQDHFAEGALVGMTGVAIDYKREKPILSAAVAGFAVGSFKEVVYDFGMGQGTFEWQDIAYTTAGAVATGLLVKGFIKLGDRWEYGIAKKKEFDPSYKPPTDRRMMR